MVSRPLTGPRAQTEDIQPGPAARPESRSRVARAADPSSRAVVARAGQSRHREECPSPPPARASFWAAGMTLLCRSCATDKQLCVGRPAHLFLGQRPAGPLSSATRRSPISGTPRGSSRGQVVVGETCTEGFHVCPARSIHPNTGIKRDTGVKRREWPSQILGSGTLGEVAVILGQATWPVRGSRREARGPGHARATRPGPQGSRGAS